MHITKEGYNTMIYDMIIIGSGPAGMTAGIYAKRAGLSVLVVEGNFVWGGQIVNTYEVDNYPGLPKISGVDLAEKMMEHMKSFQVETVRGKVLGLTLDGDLKIIRTKKAEYKAKTVIIATGAKHRKLEVPGEEELSGMGVSYCATCDGAFYKDKVVAVVGGGDVAVEDALLLADLCEKVYVVHRRDQLRAAAILQSHLFKKGNVEFLWNSEVDEICGTDEVESIVIKNNKTGMVQDLQVDGVFVAVGTVPDTAFVKQLVTVDENGYIVAGEDGETNIPGIYVAGDTRTKKLRQIITAAADGANCVYSAEKYLLTIEK